jgi:hypothetical protein
MTDYALWTWGLRSPELSIMRGQRGLNDHERRNKLGEPVAIREEDRGVCLAELATKYPCPVKTVEVAP